MIQYCSFETAKKLHDTGLYFWPADMAYKVELREPEYRDFISTHPVPMWECTEWRAKNSNKRLVIPAPTLCEVLPELPSGYTSADFSVKYELQLTNDPLHKEFVLAYRPNIGSAAEHAHGHPVAVEAAVLLWLQLIAAGIVVIDKRYLRPIEN